jgi:hypothetical protein
MTQDEREAVYKAVIEIVEARVNKPGLLKNESFNG